MDNSEKKILTIILAALLCLAVLVALLTGINLSRGKAAAKAELAEESPFPSAEIVVVTPTPSSDPVPSVSTESESSVSATPIQSASGTFSSDTGTHLNLTVNWTVTSSNAANTTIRFDFYIDSYSLNTASRNRGLTLQIGGASFSADTPPINVSSSSSVLTPLCSMDATIPTALLTCPLSVSASWHFGGSYGGSSMEYLTASGIISGA